MAEKLRAVPLGGLGEIGKNMMALELADDLILIDCGIMFPDEEMLGVDLVIPDVSYVTERLHKLRGILITHGHEDHTGALPYVLPRVAAPEREAAADLLHPANARTDRGEAGRAPAAQGDRSADREAGREGEAREVHRRVCAYHAQHSGLSVPGDPNAGGYGVPYRGLQVRPHAGDGRTVRPDAHRGNWDDRASSCSFPTRPMQTRPATRRRSGASRARSTGSWRTLPGA